jgi:hypothetical protein
VVEKPIEREIRILYLIRRINLDNDINYAINEWRENIAYNRVIYEIFTDARQIDFAVDVHFDEVISATNTGVH